MAKRSTKEEFQMEFLTKATPSSLYHRLSTPSGLSEWFCDDVNVRDGVLSFFWEGEVEKAVVLKKKRDEFIRYQWLNDKEDGNDAFFEFNIKVDAMTGDIALIVTDHAEPDNMDDAKDMWESQVGELTHILGG